MVSYLRTFFDTTYVMERRKWTELLQDTGGYYELSSSIKMGNIFTDCATISFSSLILHRSVSWLCVKM
jgi:hypothetical protein